MVSGRIGQYLATGEGAALIGQLLGLGLSPAQASAVVTAVMDGVLQLQPSLLSGGIVALLSGGREPATSSRALAELLPQVAPVVEHATGLAPTLCQQVVALVLPRLVHHLQPFVSF